MERFLLAFCYWIVFVQAAVELDSLYFNDDFDSPLSSNPFIDDTQTSEVISVTGGYEPSFDPSTVSISYLYH